MSNSDVFAQAVTIYRKSKDVCYTPSLITGQIYFSEDIIKFFKNLHEENLFMDAHYNDETVSIDNFDNYLGKIINYEINPPSGQQYNSYFSADIDELLKNSKFYEQVPSHFYLTELDKVYPEEEDDLFNLYNKATKCVGILKKISQIESNQILHFIVSEHFEIPILFTQKDLLESNFKELEKLSNQLMPKTSDHHVARIKEIFISALGESIKDVPKPKRLAHVFQHLDEIYKNYRRDYNLYAKDFSFTKLVAELNEAKISYMKRLNDVVQDISNKILSIPIAYILIAASLENQKNIKNHIIIMGAFIFAVLLIMMIINQMILLQHIKQDISKLDGFYNSQEIKSNVDDVKKKLSAKASWQKAVLWITLLVIIFIFCFCFVLYYKYTDLSFLTRAIKKSISFAVDIYSRIKLYSR